MAAPTLAVAQVLTVGRSVSGHLNSGSETLNSGEYVDRWTAHVTAGETYVVQMMSADFDTYLMVRGMLQLDNDDEGETGSTNSRLVFVAPQTGALTVSATSYAPGESGGYLLALSRAPGGQAAAAAAPAYAPPVQQNTYSANQREREYQDCLERQRRAQQQAIDDRRQHQAGNAFAGALGSILGLSSSEIRDAQRMNDAIQGMSRPQQIHCSR